MLNVNVNSYDEWLREQNFLKLGQYLLQIYINDDINIKKMYQDEIDKLLVVQKDLCDKIIKAKGKI